MDEYQEIGELLDRYATLKANNAENREKQEMTDEASEKQRAELLQYSKQKTDEILNLNNQISQLKKHMEALHLESLDYESKKDNSLQVLSYLCFPPLIIPSSRRKLSAQPFFAFLSAHLIAHR